MKYEQTVQIETSEYICLVKRIDGVVAQKTLEEELIRCKDCKYYDHGENPSESWSVCIAHINRYFETCEENFCSWAERKDNG